MELYSGDEPLTIEDREDLKETLWEDKKLAYFPWLVEIFGAQAGLFMSQLLYWTGKGHDPAGWIYKTEKDMQRETGLTRSAQRNARKVLRKKGMMEEEKRGLPRRLFYRADLQALMAAQNNKKSLLSAADNDRKDSDLEDEWDEDIPF